MFETVMVWILGIIAAIVLLIATVGLVVTLVDTIKEIRYFKKVKAELLAFSDLLEGIVEELEKENN
jgi:hypothetical protein